MGAIRYGQTNNKNGVTSTATNWNYAYNYIPASLWYYLQRPDGFSLGLDASSSTSLYTNFRQLLTTTIKSKNNAHNLNIMAGYSQEDYTTNSLGAYRQNFDFPLYEINAQVRHTTQDKRTGSSSSWALMSAFGRANYNFKERYLVEANIRYDGTSRLASESRWGIFPSFSAGWRLTEEQFMKDLNLSWLNKCQIPRFMGSSR